MTAQIDPRLETQRVAGLVVKALTDLGHAWRREDGGIQTVKFTTVGYGDVAGSLVAVLEVDTQRLPRKVSARDLTRSETLHHLATDCGHPLRCLKAVGVTYVVRLTPPLPRRSRGTTRRRRREDRRRARRRHRRRRRRMPASSVRRR